MSDLTGRAQELLANITTGPWRITRTLPMDVVSADDQFVIRVSDSTGSGDAEFIAAAPELVAGLLAALAQLESATDLGTGRPSIVAGDSHE